MISARRTPGADFRRSRQKGFFRWRKKGCRAARGNARRSVQIRTLCPFRDPCARPSAWWMKAPLALSGPPGGPRRCEVGSQAVPVLPALQMRDNFRRSRSFVAHPAGAAADARWPRARQACLALGSRGNARLQWSGLIRTGLTRTRWHARACARSSSPRARYASITRPA